MPDLKVNNNIDWSKYTEFQRKVYLCILKIPAGKTLTYGAVARRIGSPKAARAVGMALSRNLDAPIIPCHRVVGKSSLGGYSARGGLKKKIAILTKEGYKI